MLFARQAYFMISLQKILVLVRSNLDDENYINLLCIALDCMQTCSKDILMYKRLDMSLRKLKNIYPQSENTYLYILKKDKNKPYCDNWSVVEKTNPFIINYIVEVIRLLENHNNEQAYDLVDILHALSEAILQYNKWNKKNFYMNYFAPYNLKWGKNIGNEIL